MNFSQLKRLKIPQGIVQSIKTPKNMVSSSIDIDNSIFNGCGYLNGYRLNSSGGLTDMTNNLYHTSTVTGFIPVLDGEIVYIENCPWYNANSALNYICAYDSEFKFIGADYSSRLVTGGNYHYGTKFVDSASGNTNKCVIKLLNKTNVSYIRVSVSSKYVGEIISGGSILVGIQSKLTTLWESISYKNWVKYSTEADGITIYNSTGEDATPGYKKNYRIRSGGAEQLSDQSGTRSICTGFIPYTKGQILYIYPPFNGYNTQNAINFYSGTTNLGQQTHAGAGYGICGEISGGWKSMFSTENGVTKIDISNFSNADSVDHVRITHAFNDSAVPEGYKVMTGEDFIVTIDEKIE